MNTDFLNLRFNVTEGDSGLLLNSEFHTKQFLHHSDETEHIMGEDQSRIVTVTPKFEYWNFCLQGLYSLQGYEPCVSEMSHAFSHKKAPTLDA
jgi:hypothetical protein